MIYCVYEILIDGVRRYIGYTNNFNRRKRQHFKEIEKESDSKYLYKKIKLVGNKDIKVNLIKEFDNMGDAKRWEAYMILTDYFNDKQLWQSFPVSFKYF